MQKKPGQISANTLSLRFMQNAAKAKQEKEVEAAKAKVKSREEWEISPGDREGWNNETEEQGTVTYEQSYLPFLFPVISNVVASSSASHRSKTSEDDEYDEEHAPVIQMTGRRMFGKHGKEEITEAPPSEPSQPHPSTGGVVEPSRGARAISSHGRSALSSSVTSNPIKSRHLPTSTQPSFRQPPTPNTSAVQGPPVFLKPQVDGPRAETGERKRTSADIDSTEDRQRKMKKKRRDNDV